MYTLQKAKEEIDAVAKHATDIAVHTLAIADNIDSKLETFKKDISHLIDQKFAEFSKSIVGETEHFETSAVSDLGAKVAQLIHGSAPPAVQTVAEQAPHPHVDEPHPYVNEPHPHVDEPHNWDQGHQGGETHNHH
jgi:hypothetical protein